MHAERRMADLGGGVPLFLRRQKFQKKFPTCKKDTGQDKSPTIESHRPRLGGTYLIDSIVLHLPTYLV